MSYHIQVKPAIFSDHDCRNWLAINQCQLIPTKLGDLIIEFTSEMLQQSFISRYPYYACTPYTSSPIESQDRD
jgi:hypothetical protein